MLDATSPLPPGAHMVHGYIIKRIQGFHYDSEQLGKRVEVHLDRIRVL